MMVVVVYDIAIKDAVGQKRLRQIAKKCADWGVPVQNSVYECEIDAEQYRRLREELAELLCPETDSIRFYLLGNHYRKRIDTLGRNPVGWDRETFVI